MEKGEHEAVYFDVCALGRPYDDQGFPRIEAETAAMAMVIVLIKARKYVLYYSMVHEKELSCNNNDTERTEILKLLFDYGKSTTPLFRKIYSTIERRALKFEKQGMGIADAIHVAHSEAAGAAFITCDDNLIKKCHRCDVNIWYGTPVDYCKKEGLL